MLKTQKQAPLPRYQFQALYDPIDDQYVIYGGGTGVVGVGLQFNDMVDASSCLRFRFFFSSVFPSVVLFSEHKSLECSIWKWILSRASSTRSSSLFSARVFLISLFDFFSKNKAGTLSGSLVRLGNHIYTFGGEDSLTMHSSLWSFDVSTHAWSVCVFLKCILLLGLSVSPPSPISQLSLSLSM